ncbi:MAG: nuclear transport factor 2 family protein [Vicinamibacterales bacterium]|nr:nuclear transport factor 2 family protein [Vicinamibacterales bacterium]
MRIITLLSALTMMLLAGPGTKLEALSSQRPPAQVAQALVDAFNARDIEGILKNYHSDSVARSLSSGEVILMGHAEIRKKFRSIFERNSKVAVEVINRVVDEKFVIDREKITGISEGKKLVSYGTVIYEISDGLIRKEWYLKQ